MIIKIIILFGGETLEKIIKALFFKKEKRIFIIDFQRHMARFVFVLYTLFLSYKLLLGSDRFLSRELLIENRDVYLNLVPFRTISRYFEYYSYFEFWDWVSNMLGNVLIFIPIGMLLPLMNKKQKSFLLCLGIGLLMILSIEIIQHYFGLGVFDVDDIMLNELGIALGLGCYRVLKGVMNKC